MIRCWHRVAALTLVCFLCYENSLSGSFHYDDFHSIEQNYSIRSLANIPTFFTDPSAFSADAEKRMYRPVLLTTYALNYAWGQYGVESYHWVNLALHILCTLLVWGCGRIFLRGEEVALLAGLLFAVYPLATEPVNYISSRSESLAACFYLAAFYFYLTEKGHRGRLWASYLCFALGLLSKEVVVGLPAVLLAYDGLVRRHWKSWHVYAPYAFLTAAWFIIVMGNRYLVDSLAPQALVRPWWDQAWTQCKALVYYLKLVFVPWGQTAEHQFFESHGPGEIPVVLSLLLVGTLVAFAVWGQKRRLLVFFACWSLIVLGPTLVMPLNLLVNERRLYLVVAAFAWFCGYLLGERRVPVFYLCIPILGGLTWSRNPTWQDELSLWQDAAAKAPQMYRVQTNLGKALQQAGRTEEALSAYERALQIDRRHGDAYNNIATIYHLQQRYDEAIEWYNKALILYPEYEEIYQNLADAYTNKGEMDKAIAMYERALEIDDRDGGAWNNFGETLYKAGNWERAEEVFVRSAALAPNLSQPYNNLGNIFSKQQQWDRAVVMYRKALALESGDKSPILSNLGDTYLDMGQLDQARDVLEEGQALYPKNAIFPYYLGRVARTAKDLQQAEAFLQQAVQLDPTHARSQVEWAELLAARGEVDQSIAAFEAALAVDQLYSRAWYGLAQIRDRAGHVVAALEAYKAFLDIWPQNDSKRTKVETRVRQLKGEQ